MTHRTLTAVGDAAPPVWLFTGSADGDADGTAQRLREQGFDAESRELQNITAWSCPTSPALTAPVIRDAPAPPRADGRPSDDLA